MPTPKKENLDALIKYLRTPRTPEEIEARFDISNRTVYRRLDYLRYLEVDVVSRRENNGTIIEYFVLEGKS